MKPILLLLTFTLATLPARAADIRIVNGKHLDVATNTVFKKVEIQSVLPGAMPKATIKLGKEYRQVYLKNLPLVTANAFKQAKQLSDQVTAIENKIKSETQRVRRLNANRTYSSDAERISVNNAEADLDDLKDRLEDISKRFDEAYNIAMAVGKERAYFTGQKYAGLEVWDCGVKVGN